ncbi:MAG: sensor histidine kinase [Vicinamibacterales bacterium]
MDVIGAGPAASEQLRALSQRVEELREQERTRIARELHDELGQLLTGIKLDFRMTVSRLRELAFPADVVDNVEAAIVQVDSALNMVRRLSADLRPAALDHRDVGGAIEDEAHRVTSDSGPSVKVVLHIVAHPPDSIATIVFRIFHEALTNAMRHARATRVLVRLSATSSYVALVVRDNGIGLPADLGPDQALGLLGMRERARSIGGQLVIRGKPGRGTVVALRVPVPHHP